jgi:hypothetical protein
MAWATAGNIVTTNLDAGGDSPAAARPNIKAALDELIIVSNNLGATDGAAKLEANGVIRSSVTGITTEGGDLSVTSATSRVALSDVLNLNPKTVAELNALSTKTLGDVAFCSNGAEGADCIAFYDGSNWKRCDTLATISAS